MEVVTVSPKYQVVIPEKIRREEGIKPGDKMMIIKKNGVLIMMRIRPFEESKGMIPGLDQEDLREKEDRF